MARGFIRPWVALIALSALLVIPVARSHASSSAALPRCATSNLNLEFVRQTAATGHRFWDLAFRNIGATTCRLRGYPRVGLLNRNARLIHVRVDRVAGFPVRTVVLRPFQRAFFTFTFVSRGPCGSHFFNAYGLKVIPPLNAHRRVLFRGRFDVCNPSVGGRPGVYPVRRTLGH